MNSSQMRNAAAIPVVVTIGGIDPGAGAGLGRDLLTASALGAAVRMVGTAWTEQSEQGVWSIEPRAATAFADAVRRALRAPGPAVVKIGMVTGPSQAEAILRGLGDFDGPVVVDPVLWASHGGALWNGSPAEMGPLLRRATLVTPNVPEAVALTGQAILNVSDMARAAAALQAAGVSAVLVKGGHLGAGSAAPVTDLLATAQGQRRYERPRVHQDGPGPRGTGCALATAIAVALAHGDALETAIERATGWLAERIARSADIDGQRRLGA